MNRDYPASPRRSGRRRPRGPGTGATGAPSFRLFLAVDIPEDAVHDLVRWQREHLSSDRALRLIPKGQLHITLVFLGQMGEKERDQAAAQLDEIDGISAFEATATGILGLPKRGRPRVVAAAIEEPSGRLNEIHARLVEGLVEKNLYQREKRPYFPHVTIARARGRVRLDLAEIHPEPVVFTAGRVTLYNSILSREGALHEPLKTVVLATKS